MLDWIKAAMVVISPIIGAVITIIIEVVAASYGGVVLDFMIDRIVFVWVVCSFVVYYLLSAARTNAASDQTEPDEAGAHE